MRNDPSHVVIAVEAIDLSGAPWTEQMPRVRAGILDELAQLAATTDSDRALQLHHQALRIRIDHHLVLDCITSLESLAQLNLRRSAAKVAGILTGAAHRARSNLGAAPVSSAGAPGEDHAALPARPDDQALHQAVERGRTMDLPTALIYAKLHIANRTELARLVGEQRF